MRLTRKNLCWFLLAGMVFCALCSVGCGGGGGGGGNSGMEDDSVIITGKWRIQSENINNRINDEGGNFSSIPETFTLTIRKNSDSNGYYSVELGESVSVRYNLNSGNIGERYLNAAGDAYVYSSNADGEREYSCTDSVSGRMFDFYSSAELFSDLYPVSPVPSLGLISRDTPAYTPTWGLISRNTPTYTRSRVLTLCTDGTLDYFEGYSNIANDNRMGNRMGMSITLTPGLTEPRPDNGSDHAEDDRDAPSPERSDGNEDS